MKKKERKSRSKDKKASSPLHPNTEQGTFHYHIQPARSTEMLVFNLCVFPLLLFFLVIFLLLSVTSLNNTSAKGAKWVWPWPAELRGRKSSVYRGRALNTEKRSIRDTYQACRKPFPGPLPRQGHTCSWAALGTSWACAQSNKFTSINLTTAHHTLVRTKSALTHWAIRQYLSLKFNPCT